MGGFVGTIDQLIGNSMTLFERDLIRVSVKG